MKIKNLILTLLCITFISSLCGCNSEKASQKTISSLSHLQIGDEVELGKNGIKSMKWNIVAENDGSYLLVSQNTIGEKQYNEAGGSINESDPEYHANEWAHCSLHTWMNETFYEKAFDDVTKKHIATCNLSNAKEAYSKSGGPQTKDKIFILSYAECKEFLEPLDLVQTADKSIYWLRNPVGTNGLSTATCSSFLGSKPNNSYTDVSKKASVRPAIWITDKTNQSVSMNIKAATVEEESITHKKSKGTGKKCSLCNGTGTVKYYYGASKEEAYLSGHNDYEWGPCGSCHGTGVR